MTIELFKCEDGDEWYSVVKDGDVVTGVMHETRNQAECELAALS